MTAHFRRKTILVGALVMMAVALAAGVYFLRPLPSPGSARYEEFVEAFQVGLAALDAGLVEDAEKNLSRAVSLLPREPSAWANRGLLYIRISELDKAAADLDKAQALAPDHPEILKLFGLLEQKRGEFGKAADYLKKALDTSTGDVEATYRLASIIDQQQLDQSDAEYRRLLEQILEMRPTNLRVLIDRLRAAIRQSDRATVDDTLKRLKALSAKWSENTRTQLAELTEKLNDGLGGQAASAVLPFSNLLRIEPAFQPSVDEVNPEDRFVGTSLQTFVRLAPIQHLPAEPDVNLSFSLEPVSEIPDGSWKSVSSVWLGKESQPTILVLSDAQLHLINQAARPVDGRGYADAIPFDWNNDFRTDLLVVGQGLYFWQQDGSGNFKDVTPDVRLENEVLEATYSTGWAADFDSDGDLDVVLSSAAAAPTTLRNNFDGTFTTASFFPDLASLSKFAWADLDQDGACDAAALDGEGLLHVFANERGGRFIPWPNSPPAVACAALAVIDSNDDGTLDLIVLRRDGGIAQISDQNQRESWNVVELAEWQPIQARIEDVCFLAADVDNNGRMDLIASDGTGSRIWLGGTAGALQQVELQLPQRICSAVDLNQDGRLDLLGIDKDGKVIQCTNSSGKGYHWQSIRPRSAPGDDAKGDNRINSFGVGGVIEIRAGSHVVTQPINSPVMHFGLGERPRALVVRVLWPNGTQQFELTPPVDQTIVAEQRLKGSCPFLFAFNGNRFEFVKDFMWSSPLGMYINAQANGVAAQTTDWIRIAGDQMAERDGIYELRVNANLWETHFFDELALMVVDHPVGTELVVDERFFFQPRDPSFYLTSMPEAVTRAIDHHGKSADADLAAVDGKYLDRCVRGKYQGITEEHWVEVELDQRVTGGPLCLLATGWIHPTDSSINFAIEQGQHEKPHGLILEAPADQDGWRIVDDKLGFPAGKKKTILIPLEDPITGAPLSRFRLRTNMEIFWDALQVARLEEKNRAQTQRLAPRRADLRFRGILEMSQANASSPELPDYDHIVSNGQPWRDLVGLYTRFGDIRPLLEKTDDRYAILNAGDEIILEFDAPPPPPSGFKRDFVWIADGWVKDGDLNTRFGKTVLPLPSHTMTSYDRAPTTLAADPVYQQHSTDWDEYHTRFITPFYFGRGLRNFRPPEAASINNTP